MRFFCAVDIEAPVRVDGEVVRHGRMAEVVRSLVRMGFRVDHCGRQESGAWDLDDIQVKCVKASATLDVPSFDELVSSLELEAQRGDNGGMIGGAYGWSSGPCINFDGEARYLERWDVDKMAVVSAQVVPIPSFDPVNRANDEEWMARSWDRITRAILDRWGR